MDNLHAYYGKSHVLHGVSFDVRPGEIVALLGRNVFGPARPRPRPSWAWWIGRARIQLEGPGSLVGQEGLRSAAHLGLGYVPESRDVFPNLTVHQNLLLGAEGQRQK